MQARSDSVASGDLDRILAAAIVGKPEAFVRLAELDAAAVAAEAEWHGVLALLTEQLSGHVATVTRWTPWLDRVRDLVAADLVREHLLRQLLGAFEVAGLRPVLMKGAALAYGTYPRPDLRPRLDTDLLVPVERRADADRVLEGQGYTRVPDTEADLISYQASFLKRADDATAHVLDLHWRIANPQVFGRMLEYDEMAAEAVRLPALTPAARGLSHVHALLLACVHRVAHHQDLPRLIWLYDIHLLAGTLTRDQWRRFADLAMERGVGAVCRHSLAGAMAQFDTAVPPDVMSADALGDPGGSRAPAAAYLGRPRHVRGIWWDLRTLPTWRDRMRLVRQHMFPPARYMRLVYAPASETPLAILYAQRAWRGARKWLTRH